ncbi:MAG TPA: hypothetical protein VGD77_11195 [Gemmatimonadaceae bacterium]|jgi:hypothetical protein
MPKRDPELEVVKARIADVRSRHKVRWTVSPQTAEMAIAAFIEPKRQRPAGPAKKGRRQKRSKRLL